MFPQSETRCIAPGQDICSCTQEMPLVSVLQEQTNDMRPPQEFEMLMYAWLSSIERSITDLSLLIGLFMLPTIELAGCQPASSLAELS